MRIPVLSACAAFACFAQSDTNRVFYLSNGTTPVAMQQITNAIRSVSEIAECYLDSNAGTITVQADAEQIAEAQWIFDKLNSAQTLRSSSYTGTISGPANQLRIYRLNYVQSPMQYQEVVNAVRTIPGITNAFPFSNPNAIVLRADPNQMAAADWLVQQLDQPAITPAQRAKKKFQSQYANAPQLDLIYLTNVTRPQPFQEVLNALHVIPQLTKVFPDSTNHAVAISGTAEQIALAEWLSTQLDKPAPQAAAETTPVQPAPGGQWAQIFFMPASISEDSFQQTVTTVRGAIQTKLFPCTFTRALVVRGTAQQLAQAGQIVSQTVLR